MFNVARIAIAATMSFCAVAAPAQAYAPLVEPVQIAPLAIQPLAVEQAIVEQPAIEPPTVETPPAQPDLPAASLAQLVARHSAMKSDTPDLECLAVAVYFESKGEPLAGQLAVARVIKNRSNSARFARTYCGVIRQAGQFSFVRGGGFPPIARGGAHWRTAVAIATVADQGLWEAPAANALFFHARRVAPSWRMTRVASIGNHVFYR